MSAHEPADFSPLPGFPEAVQDRRDALDQAVSLPDDAVTVEDEHVRLKVNRAERSMKLSPKNTCPCTRERGWKFDVHSQLKGTYTDNTPLYHRLYEYYRIGTVVSLPYSVCHL